MGGVPAYSNGFIPGYLMKTFNWGWNPSDGDWYWALPYSTYVRHLNLVKIARDRTGRELSITDGFGAYRPYPAQVRAREIYGNGAAKPGTSSHGGIWESQYTAAMDYGNWGEVFDWDRGAFYDAVRAAGLTPGMISPERGYPDEPWHVIDFEPWSAIPSFLPGADPNAVVPGPDPALLRRQREEIMYVRGATNDDVYAVSTDPNGPGGLPVGRMRHCNTNEAAFARNVLITGDDATLTGLGIELGYTKPYTPTVDTDIEFTPEQLKEIASYIKEGMTPEQVKAAVKEGMESVVGSIGFKAK